MNIAGIITEYNPFHLGHKLHLDMTRKLTNCDAVICIMSGNFVQRGEPAFIDKWTRTDMALKNGVDLIIELPTVFALSSAEFFAFGSVSLLNSLNIVDSICFGSECGDIELLKNISHILSYESVEFKKILKSYLNNGESITHARSKTLLKLLDNNINSSKIENLKSELNSSNNILAIEYIKSLNILNSNITPFTFKRKGADYNTKDLHENISSATSIREFLKKNGDIKQLSSHLPKESYNILENLFLNNYDFADKEKIFSLLKYKVITSYHRLRDIPDVKEGLDNKILKEIITSNNLHDFILKVKSKRYTYTRISRILTQFFIGLEDYNLDKLRRTEPQYARVLGLNNTGAKVLKEIKRKSSIDIINKVPKYHDLMLSLDIKATNAYSLISNSINYNDDYKKSPIIIMDNY